MLEVREILHDSKDKVVAFITESWGIPLISYRGTPHYIDKLPGYFIEKDNNIVGAITYFINDKNECEIVSIDSALENIGIGSKLINTVIEKAKSLNCCRVWLITTNDNANAIKFYQKRGFNMSALYLNEVEKSRKVKPQIPLYGIDNIPVLHEIEFEIKLN